MGRMQILPLYLDVSRLKVLEKIFEKVLTYICLCGIIYAVKEATASLNNRMNGD